MNAIQSMLRAEFYNDVSRNGRFFYSDFNKAFNDAIEIFVTKTLSFDSEPSPTGFQLTQEARDNIYTLIKTSAPSVTDGTAVVTQNGTFIPSHANYPTDYRSFLELDVTIGGYTSYVRPTNYNEVGPLLQNVFLKPSNTKMYANEDSTGITIWRGGTGTVTSAKLTYIKTPNTFSVGNESLIISPGAAVLTNGLSYIAIDDSVQNGVTYLGGTALTAVGTSLTSGTVILTSNTTPIELPEKTHDIICKMASQIMLGVTSDYAKSQFVEKEANK